MAGGDRLPEWRSSHHTVGLRSQPSLNLPFASGLLARTYFVPSSQHTQAELCSEAKETNLIQFGQVAWDHQWLRQIRSVTNRLVP
jgi:hypothetical protein